MERELRALTKAGIVLREKRGNLTYYRADRKCPIFAELHGLILKTVGLADVIRQALHEVEGIRLAFIYGSAAEGNLDAKSDVDVLVVTDAPLRDTSAALLDAEKRLAREVASMVYTPKEFKEKMRARNHFLVKTMRGAKILLVGSPDDLV